MILTTKLNLKKDTCYINFSWEKNKTNKPTITPNLPLISRELTSKSQIFIVIGHALKLNPKKMINLIRNNLSFIPQLLKKDFATGIKLLCELEIIYADTNNVAQNLTSKKVYLLHNQMTDTAVAVNNQKVLEYFFILSKKYNFTPGIITYNIGPFINFLSRVDNIPTSLIIYTPVNQNNYLMNPDYEDVIDYLKNSDLKFVPLEN